MIQPGCCSASETQLDLKFRCPSSELFLSSTCGWVKKKGNIPLHSAGAIFSSSNEFNMPVAIAGGRFIPQTTHIDLQGLSRFEFDNGCSRCAYGNCNIERFSVNFVQEFLKYDSLAFTYLHQSAGLIPRWFTLKVLPSERSHDFRSYAVYLVYSDALHRVQECNELYALTDGLYSILVYTGDLEIALDDETGQHKSNGIPICFAVNLCEGSTSPLYISISSDAQTVLDSFGFMRDLRSKHWDIVIKHLIISDENVIPEVTFELVSQLSYWNGIKHFSVNSQNPNMITKIEFTKLFLNSIKASWKFFGHVNWFHKDFNEVCMFSVWCISKLIYLSTVLCVYVCVYMCVCVCACVCLCMCVCMCLCVDCKDVHCMHNY